jgi:hypothetical protein
MKYRLWDKQDKKMIYPEDAQDSKNLLAIGLHGLPIAVDQDSFRDGGVVGWNVDHRYVPMLSVGLPDKQGKEIYQDDFVHYDRFDSLFKVVWCNGKGRYLRGQLGWILEDDIFCSVGHTVELEAHLETFENDREEYFNGEVIGNEYENPELKEQQKQ